jgi:hypothetical protein
MLKQNGVLLAQMPLRQFGGAIAGETRTMWRNSRNMFVGGIDKRGGYPNGHLAPSAWMLPQKAGSMSAYTSTFGTGSASASGALGVNIEGVADGLSYAIATGDLIVSAFGTAAGSSSATGNMIAVLFGAGAANGSGSATATVSALAWGSGASYGVGNATLTPYAIGFMSGSTITVGGELTADEIAMAVHKYVVESGFTFEEITRINHAVLAGKVSGAGTASESFRNIDDTKDRLVVVADEFGNRTGITTDGS